MPPADLLECSFLIPLVRDIDRQPHQPLVWNALQDALYEEFAGRSGPERIYAAIRATPGEYKSHEERRVQDQSFRYIVAVPRDRLPVLRQILRKAARSFDQEAIYLSVAGRVEFITPDERDGYLL